MILKMGQISVMVPKECVWTLLEARLSERFPIPHEGLATPIQGSVVPRPATVGVGEVQPEICKYRHFNKNIFDFRIFTVSFYSENWKVSCKD